MGLDMFLETADGKETGYWRKANAIHAWFVKNCGGGVDECQRMEVTQTKLANLRRTIKATLAHPDKASEFLPTQAGFFFGPTDYDDVYFEDLEKTLDILTEAIDRGGIRFYRACW